jgi:prolipoprotein diacylglyceryltransferase
MSLIIFGILLLMRNILRVPGQLFAVYLVLNSIERGLIKQIRVNNRMHFLGMQITQAQLISTLLIILGIGIFLYFNFTNTKNPKTL